MYQGPDSVGWWRLTRGAWPKFVPSSQRRNSSSTWPGDAAEVRSIRYGLICVDVHCGLRSGVTT